MKLSRLVDSAKAPDGIVLGMYGHGTFVRSMEARTDVLGNPLKKQHPVRDLLLAKRLLHFKDVFRLLFLLLQ